MITKSEAQDHSPIKRIFYTGVYKAARGLISQDDEKQMKNNSNFSFFKRLRIICRSLDYCT